MMVEHTPSMIEQLEDNGFDVGFVGGETRRRVYLDEPREAQLRADGYRIGETSRTSTDWLAAQGRDRGDDRAPRRSRRGRRQAASRKTAKAQRRGRTCRARSSIQRAYTFSNYAGRFLYVEAHNKDHTDTAGPAMSFTYTGPERRVRRSTACPTAASPRTAATPRSAATRSATPTPAPARSTCTTAAWSRCSAPTRTCRPQPDHRARRGRHRRVRHGDAVEWAGKALPPRVAGFQKDFITKYMDPTEIYNRMDAAHPQYPDIMQAINLPNKTAGYQRQAMAMMAGTTERQRATRTRREHRAVRGAAVLEGAGPPRRQQHHRRVQGPGRRHRQRAAVDHGDRRHVARRTTRRHRRRRRLRPDQVPVKDITVNLATERAAR